MLSLGGDQQLGIHIATIEHVRAGEEVAMCQVLLDGRSHDAIGRGRRCGHHLGNEMWLVVFTALRDMNLITDPGDAALGAMPGCRLVGRGDKDSMLRSCESPPLQWSGEKLQGPSLSWIPHVTGIHLYIT